MYIGILSVIKKAWPFLCLVLVLLFSTLCPSSFTTILMGKREMVAFLKPFSWCLLTVLLCGSFSRYRGLVCSVWLWYFLIILSCFCDIHMKYLWRLTWNISLICFEHSCCIFLINSNLTVSDHRYDIGVKGQGQINSSYVIIFSHHVNLKIKIFGDICACIVLFSSSIELMAQHINSQFINVIKLHMPIGRTSVY